MQWSIVYEKESDGSEAVEREENDCSVFSMVGSIGDNMD